MDEQRIKALAQETSPYFMAISEHKSADRYVPSTEKDIPSLNALVAVVDKQPEIDNIESIDDAELAEFCASTYHFVVWEFCGMNDGVRVAELCPRLVVLDVRQAQLDKNSDIAQQLIDDLCLALKHAKDGTAREKLLNLADGVLTEKEIKAIKRKQ